MRVLNHIHRVFMQAARSGVPIYVIEAKRNYILVETPYGKSGYIVRILKDLDNPSVRYLAVAIDYGIGEVILVEMSDKGEIRQTYPWRVPIAVALNIDMFSNYEADVWSRRIYWVENNQLEILEDIGDLQVLRHREQPCITVRLKREGLHVGWYNTLMGSLDCSKEWIAKWFDVSEEKISEACEVLRRVGVRYHYLPNSL